jgi:hypothetical protein
MIRLLSGRDFLLIVSIESVRSRCASYLDCVRRRKRPIPDMCLAWSECDAVFFRRLTTADEHPAFVVIVVLYRERPTFQLITYRQYHRPCPCQATPTTITIATTIIVIVVMTLQCAKHRTFDIQRYTRRVVRQTVPFAGQVSSVERSLRKAAASA